MNGEPIHDQAWRIDRTDAVGVRGHINDGTEDVGEQSLKA